MNYFIIFLLLGLSIKLRAERILPLLMPNIPPEVIGNESYICSAFKTNPNESEFITEFKPKVLQPINIHHILIFGCQTVSTLSDNNKLEYWRCGDMPDTSCGPGHVSYLYVWSKNAPTYTLPNGVGFKIGGNSKINYIVIQTHYIEKEPINSPDNSGFLLKIVSEKENKISKFAGIFTPQSDFKENKRAVIPAHSKLYFENACPYDERHVLHPISFRVNTNSRGKVVSGWLIRKESNQVKWSLIGRHSPNPYQSFIPIKDRNLEIKQNDWIAMRCTMVNHNDYNIVFGSKDSEETCNYYIIFYTDRDIELKKDYCVSFGPPYYSWKTDVNLPGGRVPDWVNREASRFDEDEKK